MNAGHLRLGDKGLLVVKFIFAILAAGIPWLLVAVDPSFPFYKEICEEGSKAAKEYCAGYEVASFSVRGLGKFFDDHAGAISALATVFIGFFTFTLYKATDQLRCISDRQVRTFTNAERPWLFIHKFKLRQQQKLD